MAWISITEADVLTVLAGPELAAYRSAAKKGGQADPVPEMVAQVTSEIRGYVANCERNTLGAGATIPSELLKAALDRLAVMIPKRAAGRNPTESRRAANEEAIKLFEAVAACKFAVVAPETPSDEAIGAGSPRITPKRLRFDQYSQDGI